MRVLKYAGLDAGRLAPAFEKLCAAIERDDWRSAEVKKLAPGPYYRAKLDAANRLLLSFVRHEGRVACLALEIITQHAYERSRFLRGAKVDEAQIEDASEAGIATDAAPIRYLHPTRSEFQWLDKPISFDDAQEAIYRLPAPLVLVGSAGSGKTALTLARLRHVPGEVLYLTQSPWLARNARDLYFADGFDRLGQEIEFLSWREFLETLRVPSGREVDFVAFRDWFSRHRQQYRFTDAHQCLEEFRGVIGSEPEGPLARAAYLALGSRQSIFPPEQRGAIHELFEKYRGWLDQAGLYDSNLIAQQWQALADPRYDFVVIDEVQDFTNAQLALALRCLRKPGQFLLCGDSNQIVHPNFFSWSAVKRLFWRDPALAERQTLSVLGVNYRNARMVSRIANDVLKIKYARFGSIDRESNHLVESAAAEEGEVRLIADKDAFKRELDARTRGSTRYAVLVLRDEDKSAARSHFRTPLVFSVHEAKGLEYPNIILYRFISDQRPAYAELCAGVEAQDLAVETLDYRRARDKQDKSLEVWKFYVNALYVALTRAVERVWLVESDVEHPLFALLRLRAGEASPEIRERASSQAEWEREAHRLEQHGKHEQAEAIRKTVLRVRPVPWAVWNQATIEPMIARALDPKEVSSKLRQQVLDFALWHRQENYLIRLAHEAHWPPAEALLARAREGGILHAIEALDARHLAGWTKRNFKEILAQCDQHGVDHRTVFDTTPLMMAARAGNPALVDALLERGADIEARDLFGQTPAMHVLERATLDRDYASGAFGAVFVRVRPPVLDVETDGRLVRLYPHQGEYLVLMLMLSGLKTLCSQLVPSHGQRFDRRTGFNAAWLMRNIEAFPHVVLHEERRKRAWFNAVLARAEMNSTYAPARRLWVRTRTGFYLPNAALQLPFVAADGQGGWQPWQHAMKVELALAGTTRSWAQRHILHASQVAMDAASGSPIASR